MGLFSTEGLKLLRKYREKSQESVSTALGITQGTFSKIEKGLLEPNEVQTQALSRFFGVRPEFFQQSVEAFDPMVPLHRSKAALQIRVRDRVEAAGNLWRMHLQKLIDAFDYQPLLTPIPLVDIEPEEAALVTRRNLKLPRGPVKNLVSLLEDNGVFVVRMDFSTSLIDGFTIVGDGRLPVIFLNTQAPADRSRFTLAHELGHLIMHERVITFEGVDDQADAFASAFLMPREDIEADLRYLSLAKLAMLKVKWKVSMGALLYRAKSIGTITENQSRYLWMQMSARGYRTQEPNPLPPESPTMVAELLEKYQGAFGYSDEELCRVLMIAESELQVLKSQVLDKRGKILRFRNS